MEELSQFTSVTSKNNFRISLDWFSFTFYDPNVSDKEQLSAFVSVFPFIKTYFDSNKVVAASNHYEWCIRIDDGVCLSWDINNDKGVNLSVSGSHLGLFYDWFPELLNNRQPFRALLYILALNNCRPSRVDIAFDDFSKHFRPVDFQSFDFDNRLISPYRSTIFFHNRCSGATTFQLGKRSSGSHLRIYDKDLESNGEIDAVRYEFELHYLQAQAFCNTYMTYGSINWYKWFLDRLRVVVNNSDVKRKSNLETDPAFIELTLSLANISSNVVIMEHNIDSRPEKVLKTAIQHLKGVILYCSSIPKDVLYTLLEEIKYNFTDADFKKANMNKESLSRFFNYSEFL